MAMFLSVAKNISAIKTTEQIYVVILTNTEPSHVKCGADLHEKECNFLLYKGCFEILTAKLPKHI